jgi:hypothetical protein
MKSRRVRHKSQKFCFRLCESKSEFFGSNYCFTTLGCNKEAPRKSLSCAALPPKGENSFVFCGAAQSKTAALGRLISETHFFGPFAITTREDRQLCAIFGPKKVLLGDLERRTCCHFFLLGIKPLKSHNIYYTLLSHQKCSHNKRLKTPFAISHVSYTQGN